MTDYDFDYTSLDDRITNLELEVEHLRNELIESDNTLYEILNRLDMLEQKRYDVPNY
jgi:septal ring factor EnvC (AmiA/AmiB activator)